MQALVRLIAIQDSWLLERVRMVLHDSQIPALLSMAVDMHSSPPLPILKRFAVIRLIIMLTEAAPQVSANLPVYRQEREFSGAMQMTQHALYVTECRRFAI